MANASILAAFERMWLHVTNVLSNKSDISHVHSIGEITNLESKLNGKAEGGHVHGISDVTNLQSSLDSKSDSGHKHSASDITSGTLSSDRFPTVPLTKGGTGATNASSARTNLDVYSKTEVDNKITSIKIVRW